MISRIVYRALIILIALGLGFVYFHRLEIPLTRNFEDLLNDKIVVIQKQKEGLALSIVRLEAEQSAEQALREEAKSNSYSNPFRALNTQWFKSKIVILSILQFLFTYRIIFYILIFLFIIYAMHFIFWRYYAF